MELQKIKNAVRKVDKQVFFDEDKVFGNRFLMFFEEDVDKDTRAQNLQDPTGSRFAMVGLQLLNKGDEFDLGINPKDMLKVKYHTKAVKDTSIQENFVSIPGTENLTLLKYQLRLVFEFLGTENIKYFYTKNAVRIKNAEGKIALITPYGNKKAFEKYAKSQQK